MRLRPHRRSRRRNASAARARVRGNATATACTRRVHPQSVATSRKRAELLDDTAAADNFINLSELPVLFHVLCLVLLFTHNETALIVSGAWLYVILRTGHSLIQCTYNRVLHRFSVYLASTAVLIALWVGLAARLLG